jgi:hypothetical protein
MLNTRYGAESSEWNSVFCNDDLRPWVLPIVSNVNIPLSPNSSIKEVGKTPTIKNRKGFVAGVKEWTALPEATDAQIMAWAKDPDNGYCVRTGHNGLIGIDCDVNDPELSKKVKELFLSHCHIKEEDFTYRTRGGARWATFVKLDTGASRAKQVVNLDGTEIDGKKPVVEFLGLGQQLACAGTHPSGKKYSWPRGLGVLEVTESDYNNFLAALVLLYGAEDIITAKSSAPRVKGESYAAEDRLRDWLLDKGLVLKEGRAGELYIRCPWEELHTSDTGDTQTVYFPVGSNGYDAGGFHCFHAHCSNKTIADFKAWAKSQGYQETSAEDFPDESANNGNNSSSQGYYYALGRLSKWYSEKTGEYDVTPDSVSTALSYPAFCGYYIRYDTFFGKILVKPFGDNSADWEVCADKDNLALRIALERHGFKPRQLGKELIKDAVNSVAQDNTGDYMEDYIKNKLPKWDGVQRAERFLIDYCGAEDTEYSRALGRYFWGLAWRRAANRQPIKADISLILIGAQGAKKSTFVKTLAMEDRFYIDLDFKNKSDEIALRIGGRIIAEVPEMNGFQQRANSELKAFLSMSEDTYRVMYSQDQRTVTRRNMLIITENRRYILSDTTGNRRYAPIEVSKFDSEKIKDVVPLLWAEGAEIFKKYGGEKLHTDVEEITAERNDKYMIGDVWAETIAEYIENQSSLSDNERLPLTSGNIMRYGLKLDAGASSNPAICRRFNSVMETLGYARKVRRVKGKNAPVRDWVKIEE